MLATQSFLKNVPVVLDFGITYTGGTLSTDGDYKIYKWSDQSQSTAFTIHADPDSGTFAVLAQEIDYLVVGGGGSGGSNGPSGGSGGGGGAGEFVYVTGWTPSYMGNYNIVAGVRGGTSSAQAAGNNGTDSSIETAIGGSIKIANGGGGGGGAHATSTIGDGKAGGSGGGAGSSGTRSVGASVLQGAGLGNPGALQGSAVGGGGGGGAGGTAVAGSSSTGGHGGAGQSNSIMGGSAITYAMGGAGGCSYAGTVRGLGGGSSATTSGDGGLTGNENGYPATYSANPFPGSGGGGASYDASAATQTGGAGSPGVVILRWKFQ